MNKIFVFLLSLLPLNIKSNGTVKFSFGNLALQGMTILLICGIYYKWFTLRNVESADILGIAGLIFGTGFLVNQHKKNQSDSDQTQIQKEPSRPSADESPK